MRIKLLSLYLLLFFCINSFAQQANLQIVEDSLLKIVKTAKTTQAKCESYMNIAQAYTGQNLEKETEYINKTIFEIEQSRDRKLIAIFYKKIADQWLSMSSNTERQANGLDAIEKGLAIAKESQLNEETASLLVKKAYTYRVKGKPTEALKFNEEAINYAELTKNDSLKIATQLSSANTLLAKDENLAAFKKYMLALNLAEAVNQEKLKLSLYERVANIYSKIGQTEKAKDYYIKGLNLSKKLNDSTVALSIYSSLTTLYANQKDYVTAREYLKILYEKGKTSTRYYQSAISAESNIIAQEDISKLPEFLKKNIKILDEYVKYKMFSELYRLKGVIFTVEQKFDSASYYLLKSKKEINPTNLAQQVAWNQSYAFYLDKSKKYNEAAKYIEQNVLIAKQTQSLTEEKECYEYLDSLYLKAGNESSVIKNKVLLYTIKDSLDKQQKANDLLSIEIDIENKRTERENFEKTEKLQKRNNLQYMGITAFIISLFIALAAMGRFKVKPWFIRSLGFVSFILLFEFIILLIDHQLHQITHGEPLPILLVKIVLIAFLMPFHHWLEHKVIHYLMRHADLKHH